MRSSSSLLPEQAKTMKQNEIKISGVFDEEVMAELNGYLMTIGGIEKLWYNLRSKGIIIVKFNSEEQAKNALNKISQKSFKGKKLDVAIVI